MPGSAIYKSEAAERGGAKPNPTLTIDAFQYGFAIDVKSKTGFYTVG